MRFLSCGWANAAEKVSLCVRKKESKDGAAVHCSSQSLRTRGGLRPIIAGWMGQSGIFRQVSLQYV